MTFYVCRGTDTVSSTDISDAGGLTNPITSSIDMDGFDITDLDDITFRESGQNILSDTTGLHFTVPTGDIFEYLINGVSELDISETRVDFKANDIYNITDLSTNFGQTLNPTASGWTLNVPTGNYFQITVNGVNKAKFDINGLNMQTNYIDNVDKIISAHATDDLIDFLASSISYEVGTGDLHQFKVGGTVEMTIEGGGVNVKNNYIEFGEGSTPAGTTNAGRLYVVDNGSGKSSLRVIFGSGAAQTLATEP